MSQKRQVFELSLKDFTHGDSQARKKFIDELFVGLKEYGFINLRDHGVDSDLLKKAYELSEQLFNIPEETKKQYVLKGSGGARGYTTYGKEHAKESTVMYLIEFWQVGRDPIEGDPSAKYFAPNIWPKEVSGFKELFEKLYNELDKCAFTLLK